MIKHWRWGLAVIVLLAAGHWMLSSRPAGDQSFSAGINGLPKTVAALKPRTVIDSNKKPINRLPASISYVNKPSPDWEVKLKDKLKHQAPNLKEIMVEKESSLVWVRDDNALLVESVKISLKNQKNEQTSFRAMVDSQTGKVIETWDRSIIDSVDTSHKFGIKIDPRYSY